MSLGNEGIQVVAGSQLEHKSALADVFEQIDRANVQIDNLSVRLGSVSSPQPATTNSTSASSYPHINGAVESLGYLNERLATLINELVI